MYLMVCCHRGFENDNAAYLFITNKEVRSRNSNVIKSLYKPITLIEALNMGNLSRASNAMTRGLASVLFLCVDLMVVITANILQFHVLYNGSTGTVSEIV